MAPILTAEMVRLNTPASDWQEAVALAGGLLEQNGYVEKRYIEATLAAVRTLGPYIVLAPGMAFPHARPEDGAIKTGISLVTLSSPVRFGSVDNDPVDLVVGLSSVDSTSHIELLQRMCNFLSDNKNVRRLKELQDPSEVAAFINEQK